MMFIKQFRHIGNIKVIYFKPGKIILKIEADEISNQFYNIKINENIKKEFDVVNKIIQM